MAVDKFPSGATDNSGRFVFTNMNQNKLGKMLHSMQLILQVIDIKNKKHIYIRLKKWNRSDNNCSWMNPHFSIFNLELENYILPAHSDVKSGKTGIDE